MAPTFIFAIAGQLLGKLKSPDFQELSLAWGVRDDLHMLENTVSCVRSVLLDAEEQQTSNHQLKNWLEKLEDALYRAQDVLEEFETDALRYKVCDRTILRKVRRGFSPSNRIVFRFKIAHKMKNIREEFDEIANNRNGFSLIERFDESVVVLREMTHSFKQDEDIIGRDEEKEAVISFLMDTTNDKCLSVLPITGLSGMGKTTIAKLVCNDERVVKHFDSRIWVSVPEDFKLEKVIRKILMSAGSVDCDNLPLEQLKKKLRVKLENHKYLFILDDVSILPIAQARWKALRDSLIGGGQGVSKFIFTTRKELVASIMATTDIKIKVKSLSFEDSKCLFLKWAFRSSQESITHPNLVEIAESIVKKCKGGPFAVRILGSILYTITDEREWINVRDSEIWKIEQKECDIMPALKLSYYQLPTDLKRCFAFCSIFPKNYEFNSLSLPMFWRANGLVQHVGNNQDVDDFGLLYIKQLQSRGFFQEFDSYGSIVSFKMHEFVHNLALLVAENCHFNRMVRHISLPIDYFSVNEIPSWLLEQKENLQTLYFPGGVGDFNATVLEACISKFKSLRLLDLSKSSFEVLPSSIGNMKHLKHLDLSDNYELKTLPASICELVSLEFLRFNGCLNIKKLPRGLGQLIRLKTLGITTNELQLPEDEIRCLKNLQHLTISCCPNLKFVMSDDAMKSLSSLRTFCVSRCESLVSLPVSGLRHLIKLETLSISDCGNINFMTDYNNYDNGEKENGKGLHNLLTLSIRGFQNLESLPLWLLDGANNLRFIFIDCCDNLTVLIPERMLECLKSIHSIYISECPKLKSQGMCSLTALDKLSIWNCPELVRKCQREIGEDWHNICHIPNIYLDDVEI